MISDWLNGRDQVDRSGRSETAWIRIQDDPASITLVRRVGSSDTTIAAQTMRLVPTNSRTGSERAGAAGKSGSQDILMFGVRSHATVADTDIQRDDRFVYQGKQYRVIYVNVFPSQIQALAEAQS